MDLKDIVPKEPKKAFLPPTGRQNAHIRQKLLQTGEQEMVIAYGPQYITLQLHLFKVDYMLQSWLSNFPASLLTRQFPKGRKPNMYVKLKY